MALLCQALNAILGHMSYRAQFVLGLLLVFSASPAQGTQVLAMDLPEMVDASVVIVWGSVVSTKASRIPEAPGRIHTQVKISVRERLKHDGLNPTSASVTLVVPGGVVGKYGQMVSGAPGFVVGEEVVLLLERQPKTRRLLVVGFSQGRYVIHRKPNSPVVEAVSDRAGVRLVKRDQLGRLSPAPPAAGLDRRPLSVLLNAIRQRVNRPR